MPVAQWQLRDAVFYGAWTSKKSRGKNLRDKKTKDKSNWPTPVECGERNENKKTLGASEKKFKQGGKIIGARNQTNMLRITLQEGTQQSMLHIASHRKNWFQKSRLRLHVANKKVVV